MDYVNFPMAPLEGYRAPNNDYLTASLFVEMHRGAIQPPRFSIGDTEVEWEGRIIPCARLVYINSKSEHDAMSKLVGSYRQWCKLKELAWFKEAVESWHDEWLMIQGGSALKKLTVHSLDSVSAAKTIFDHANKNARGRPRKSKMPERDDSGNVDDDISRVVEMRR